MKTWINPYKASDLRVAEVVGDVLCQSLIASCKLGCRSADIVDLEVQTGQRGPRMASVGPVCDLRVNSIRVRLGGIMRKLGSVHQQRRTLGPPAAMRKYLHDGLTICIDDPEGLCQPSDYASPVSWDVYIR